MSYISSHKKQLLDSLENKVLYADFCSLIIGKKGIGKSFFLSSLGDRLEGQVNLSAIEASPELTVQQLDQSVSLQLGLKWQDNKQTLLERISERLEQRALLTIDNAHQLSQQCLEYLMSLVSSQVVSTSTCLFIVLGGEPELAKKLGQTKAVQSNPNICVVFELQPIESSEVNHLVAHFQSIDVGTAEALYDEQKLDYLWQLSKGVPGELEYQLKRWLAQKEVKPLEEKAPPKKSYLSVILYASIALVFVTALMFQEQINQWIDSADSDQSPTSQSPAQSAVPKSDSQLAIDKRKSKEDSEAENDTGPTDAKQVAEKLKGSSEKQGKPEQKQITESKSASKTSTLQDTQAPEQTDQQLTKNDEELNKESSSTPIQKQQNQQTSVNLQTDSQADVKLKQSKQEGTKRAEATSNLTADERALAGFEDTDFVLQWVVVSSLSSAESFRSSHPLAAEMLIFRRPKGDEYLFFVVSGRYRDNASAESSRRDLQAQGLPGKPWVKAVAAIKKDISKL